MTKARQPVVVTIVIEVDREDYSDFKSTFEQNVDRLAEYATVTSAKAVIPPNLDSITEDLL